MTTDPSTDQRILEIYRGTIDALYGYIARRVAGARDLAEDITQETYLRAVDRWQTRGLPREPLAWLQRVARNLVVDHYRKRRPQPLEPGAVDELLARPILDDDGAAETLCRGLMRLGRAHCTVLEAFYLDGQATADIARTLGISERAVEGRLRRARAALREHLQPTADNGAAR